MTAREPVFTREQAAVFALTLEEAASVALDAQSGRTERRQLARELRVLRRMLPKATAGDVLSQIAAVRASLGASSDSDALAGTLAAIERAARHSRNATPPSFPTTGETP